MIEIVYSKEVNKKDEYLRLPKNVRQTGIVQNHKKVYIEDYVNTFMGQFLDDIGESRGVLILMGKTVYNSMCDYAFISGCLWIKGIEMIGREVFFNDKIWGDIYSQAKDFFPDLDIVGWSIVLTDELLGVNDAITRTHKDNFPGKEKILIIKEVLEKEEKIYNMENGILREHKGHYVYYEKNPQMQSYMMSVKENSKPLEQFNDSATKNFRMLIKEKETQKKQKGQKVSLAATGLFCAVGVILAGVSYGNYGKLDSMQNTLNYITNIINEKQVEEWFSDIELTAEKKENTKTNEEVQQSNEPQQSDEVQQASSDSIEITNVTGGVDKVEETEENTTKKDAKEEEANQKNKDNNKDSEKDTAQSDEDVPEETDNNPDSGGVVTEIESSETEIKGNVDETQQETQQETSAPVEEQANTYTVVRGDSLEKISIKLYGNKKQVSKICKLNGIEDVDKIFIGQELIVP